MKLYYRPGTCALAPHILLEHVGIDYEAVSAPAPPDFKEINPTGAVPVLELSEEKRLSQCGAILQFVCEVSGRDDLLGGTDPFRRATVGKWVSFFTGDFHPAFFPFFAPQRYTTSIDEPVLSEVKQAGRKMVQNGLAEIERQLSEQSYLAGKDLTVADFYSVPMLRWCKFLFSEGLKGWPETEGFYHFMNGLRATQQALRVQRIAS